MASPIAVGTTAIVAVPTNANRANVRFQNVGNTNLFFARDPVIPSSTVFEFMLSHTGGDPNAANYETNSTSKFNVVSSGANGSLAIFETTIKSKCHG